MDASHLPLVAPSSDPLPSQSVIPRTYRPELPTSSLLSRLASPARAFARSRSNAPLVLWRLPHRQWANSPRFMRNNACLSVLSCRYQLQPFSCLLRRNMAGSERKGVCSACLGRSTGGFPADEFGYYPWDPALQNSDSHAIEWIQEDLVTLFTTDGLIQIGGSLIPRLSSPSERRQSPGRVLSRFRRFKEEDYMDPKQGLCLGSLFDIVATNGLDMGRRFCVFGFCRSIEMLSDVVEDTVLEQGGEVVIAEKSNSGGLNEKLSMTVAVPFLWGVPPAVDSLNYAIRCGGGIVEKVSCEWEFL